MDTFLPFVPGADRRGDRFHVNRSGCVYGDEDTDAHRAVVLGHILQPERGDDVHRMDDAGVVALDG
jgi:hypothetical protein